MWAALGGVADGVVIPEAAAGACRPCHHHGSSNLLHSVGNEARLVEVFPFDCGLLVALQDDQCFDMGLEVIYFMLVLLGLFEVKVVGGLLLERLEVLELHYGLSVQLMEVGKELSLLVPDHLPLFLSLVSMDEQCDQSYLVEDVDGVGVVLMEHEAEQSQGSVPHTNLPQFPRLVVGVESRLEGSVA